ncbi:MAG: alpha/beta hydrolase [Cyanobacteria bacterium P01_E01_bin.45]
MSSLSRTLAVSAVALASLVALPAMAADEVTISTNLGSRSVDRVDLEHYARTGEAEGTLRYFTANLSDDQERIVRRSLRRPIDVDFLPFSKFVRSELGTTTITELADGIEPGSPNVVSEQALRAALVGAASDGSMSILDLLAAYPTQEVVLDWPDLQSMATDFQDSGTFSGALGLVDWVPDNVAANVLELFIQPASATTSSLSAEEMVGLQRSLSQLRRELTGVMGAFTE